MNQEYALKGKLVADGQELHNGLVVVGNGTITYAGKADEYGKALPDHVVTVEDGWICPGFVDMHMHGIDGYDTMDGTPESLQAISTALARHGVTSFWQRR